MNKVYKCIANNVVFGLHKNKIPALKVSGAFPWIRTYGDNAAYVVVKDATASGLLPSRDSQIELLEFNKLLPDIVRDLTETSSYNYEIADANKWLTKVLQYNLTPGNKVRGLSVVESYKILTNNDKTLEKMRILGWCLEMLYTSMVMTQDRIYEVKTRRGKPCWYLGVKDKFDNAPRIVEASLYKLLKLHFDQEPYYAALLDQFHNISSKAMMGLELEMKTRSDKNLNQFTMERYSAITKYTTSYISFKLPVTLAMTVAGIKDPEVYRQAKTILLEMGYFFQAQRDFKNCYGSSTVAKGTDIEDGKCTWLAVVALQRASPSQRNDLVECYGKKDETKSQIVRDIYAAVGLRSTFKRFQQHSCQLLCTQIQQVSRGLAHKLFLRFLKGMSGFSE